MSENEITERILKVALMKNGIKRLMLTLCNSVKFTLCISVVKKYATVKDAQSSERTSVRRKGRSEKRQKPGTKNKND